MVSTLLPGPELRDQSPTQPSLTAARFYSDGPRLPAGATGPTEQVIAVRAVEEGVSVRSGFRFLLNLLCAGFLLGFLAGVIGAVLAVPFLWLLPVSLPLVVVAIRIGRLHEPTSLQPIRRLRRVMRSARPQPTARAAASRQSPWEQPGAKSA